jgi:hypothetical protein
MNELKNHLKNFNELNSKIQSIESSLSTLKQQRDTLEDNILTILENNDLTNKDIRMGDIKYQYHVSNKKEIFTQQFIKNNLILFFKEIQNQSNENAIKNTTIIFDYLLNKRNSKETKSLKISKLLNNNKTN